MFSASALALSHTNFPALDNVTVVDGREDSALPNVRRKSEASWAWPGVKEKGSNRDNMWMGFQTNTQREEG